MPTPETQVTQDWTKLDAGIDLDLEVAVRVFGVDRAKIAPDPSWGALTVYQDDGLGDLILPRYSHDIKAAWQVVEKLRDRFWLNIVLGARIDGPLSERDESWHEVGVGWHGETSPRFAEVAGTLPHAICRAALATMEVPRG